MIATNGATPRVAEMLGKEDGHWIAVPTCVGPDRPPKYPTTYYTDYMVAYQKRTYDLLADQQAAGGAFTVYPPAWTPPVSRLTTEGALLTAALVAGREAVNVLFDEQDR